MYSLIIVASFYAHSLPNTKVDIAPKKLRDVVSTKIGVSIGQCAKEHTIQYHTTIR